ncbi:glutamyl-tRNA synthetase [Mucilaginibacter mallensis]|uniref:Glutamyl-tRNA synthetase n=1 Tax=Mucilaginibacter mallensis TaxID=652787 RepID=A0A1H2BP26_MUCMA|nr:glutamate--tRNA ligase family protein [Mucilaginibacter mallensis]SDT59948.1 glutamyl-tRNA synthetase [Mucilaginibacter mallensis]
MPDTARQYTQTRIAPTPSGFLHLGNVLSFSITAALAQKHGTKILLRIDDIDRARVTRQYLQDIFDTLNFLEIPWDDGPRDVDGFEKNYSQLQRMPIYMEALEQLRSKGQVFACTCSRKQISNIDGSYDESLCTCFDQQIPLSTEHANWRLITNNEELVIKDYSGKDIRATLPAEMHNFIVKKKDGSPAYQLTSVMDDLLYGVDLIVRGEDLWPSTLAQHQLAATLGESDFNDIVFYHHPLMMEPSGKKLSKSAGSTSIKYLRENGKSKADVYTIIAGMLGSKESISNWQELAELVNL